MNAQVTRPWAALAALIVLIAAGVLIHHIALAHVDIIGTLSARMKPTAAARVQFVSYIATHPWFVLPYLAIFLAGLLWTRLRKLPGWSLWLTFTFLALPILGYIWICFRITTTNFVFAPP
jgi:hypothetical protein